MPKDVHKSLELLEEYHAELFRSSDAELKYYIEKVLGIFKTNLFNSLCDIQEFYDNVLLNKKLSVNEKIFETRRFVDRWQQKPIATTSETPLTNILNNKRIEQKISVPFFSQSSRINKVIDEFGREWEIEEVLLDASQIGLGFSISGGRDRDSEQDSYIRVTDISPGGAVAQNGCIRMGDIILKINDTDCVNVNHNVAVTALQKAGPFVRLLVKRLKLTKCLSQSKLNEINQFKIPFNERQRTYSGGNNRSRLSYQAAQPLSPHQNIPINQLSNYNSHELSKNIETNLTKATRTVTLFKREDGLGFNIVGGEDNEPIFISHVLPGGAADLSGNVQKGDVLLQVNNTILRNATHAQAAYVLKSIPPNSYVQLVLQYCPNEYYAFKDKVIRFQNDMINKNKIQYN